MPTDLEELLKQVQSLSPAQQQLFRELLDRQNGGTRADASRRDAFLQRLLHDGLISGIKRPGTHVLPTPRRRIQIQGQPLSQTVIEERR